MYAKSLVNKKFVLIMADQITPRNLAYAGALIGFQFGRKIPEMVGRDQMIPTRGAEGVKRKHHGITTQNLPVLNGLSVDNMRVLQERFRGEEGLLVTLVTSAVEHCATYEEYAKAIAETPPSDTIYWGIGVFGDEELINKHTQGLKLYDKLPKVPNTEVAATERRLIGNQADLPTIRFILANNIPGGRLANNAAILGITYGKLYGDELFGPDLTDSTGQQHLGLPMIDFGILHGHSDSNRKMRELREALHAIPELSIVDVTDATKTRSYEDYLAIAENKAVLDTVYWGVGLCGTNELVAKHTADFAPYITSAEEQAMLKKQQAAQKLAARKAAQSSTKAKDPADTAALSKAAANGGLGWQQHTETGVKKTATEETKHESSYGSTF